MVKLLGRGLTNMAVSLVEDASRPAEGRSDRELWRQLLASEQLTEFANAWLALQCGALNEPVRAVILLRGDDHQEEYQEAGVWPSGATETSWLASVAETAIEHKTPILRRKPGRSVATTVSI